MSTSAGAGFGPFTAAEKAVSVIGFGYDVNRDIFFSSCKSGPSGARLIDLDPNLSRDLVFPGAVVVPNVPNSIKCYKGEHLRISSDVLSFDQMSQLLNQELSLAGKIPSGLFNNMFNMTHRWQRDASSTKSLAFDGWFITMYNVELDRTNITLCEAVKKEVPSSWNPLALAEFIEKYGTHIVVGAKIGGKDVVHLKQSEKSDLQPAEVQRLLEKLAEERFSEESSECSNVNPAEITGKLKGDHVNACGMARALTAAGRPQVKSHSKNDELLSISVRRGGIDVGQSFNQWLSTISQAPNIISMSFVPITSLLHSVPGHGFLRHAVNLYLACKPPIEELHEFLQFQLPREWAKVHDGLGFGPRQRRIMSPSLQFTFKGNKLYVNTEKVDTGYRPVTGIRLFLEGRESNYLAVHLQHLSNLPSIFHISDHHYYEPADESIDQAYYEAVKCRMFSHVCTAPVQYNGSHIDGTSAIVTKAWIEVKLVGMKEVLFLRLGFSKVSSAGIRRSEWDGPSTLSRKSGFFSALISTRLSKELHPPQKPISKKDINSAAYNGNSFDSSDAPVPTKAPKMLSFVDTTEMVRGPGDIPGYWVVTGAKLCVVGGRISIKAKYSLLTVMSEESLHLM
ncbi:hypothetical protein L6164_036711 [Bauhinia variegata]|uniref:Uncharacterized protein n=1 Tax=Bauhinia variegata TaxID=167791 RepID=A0ACB9KI17_BAUVA|nr:hypothetical protein L6164_036711 [Bauhinia variegata]